MKIVAKNLEETRQFAHEFLHTLKPLRERATIIVLSGDLGAGKTAFVKSAAEYFGIKEDITSPTFVIMKNYELRSTDFGRLVHIDAYRLEKREELERLRFSELLHDPQNIIFLEWPEKVEGAVPQDAITLKFTFIDETTRQIEW